MAVAQTTVPDVYHSHDVVVEALRTAEKPLTIAGWRSADEIKAIRSLVVQVMREVMKEDVHYGVIPGCDKPSLWKPGAEILFSTFRIAVDPVVTNMSTPDEIHYQVMAYATSASQQPLGSSIGECSSNEDKYKWRRSVCNEEWEGLPDSRRRLKWKRGNKGFYQVQQVRAEMFDCANTVLKMALKRALVGLALQVTAASDVFTQGIEDLPEELRDDMINEYAQEFDTPTPASLPTEIKRKPLTPDLTKEMPAPRAAAKPPQSVPSRTPAPRAAEFISEGQSRRFYALWKTSGKTRSMVTNYLLETFGIDDDRKMPAARYEEACAWAKKDGF